MGLWIRKRSVMEGTVEGFQDWIGTSRDIEGMVRHALVSGRIW